MKKLLLYFNLFVLVFFISGLNRANALITTHPKSVAECATNSTITISFSVVATCKGTCTYQWQAYNRATRLWVNLVNSSGSGSPKVAGVNTSTLQLTFGAAYTYLTTAFNGTSVRCIVSGETSREATLTVYARASITGQPVSTAVVAGQPASFTVTASGSNLSYQWQKNAVNITGATSSSYSIAAVTSADAGTYTCVVSNTCNTVTSSGAVLTVYPLLTITKQPIDNEGCEGSTSTVFKISVTGSSLSFQWQVKPYREVTWTNIPAASGGTNQNLSITTPLNSTINKSSFRCIVNASGGQSVTSNSAVLYVIFKPSITSNPSGATKTVGESVTFTVVASGTSLSYQWQKNNVNIPGATGSSHTIASLVLGDAGTYRCLVSNSCLSNVASGGAILTVNPSAKDGWYLQDDAGDDLDIMAMEAVSSSIAWAVLGPSSADKLIKTVNGGMSWTGATTGTSGYWTCIEFVNANLGFVGGYYKINKTTDGGATWNPYDVKTGLGLPDYPYVYRIRFVSTTIGYAVGANGLIMKTIDGGTTWVKQNYGADAVKVTSVNLYGVHFLDANNGFVAGNNGVILKTTNGGGIWTELTSGTNSNLNDIHFVSTIKGFATSTSSPYLLKTENGGTSWTPVTGFSSIYPKEIEFVDANHGYMAGQYYQSPSYFGTIMKTKDGGATWVRQKMEGTNPVYCLDMVDLNHGYAGGKAGELHHTIYGGCVNPAISLYEDRTFCSGQSYQLVADTVSRNWAPGLSYLWTPGGSTDGSISVSTTGTYTVTLTNECNVTASDAATITFLALPETNAGPDVSMCLGDSVQLTGTGDGTYSWNHTEYLNNPSIPNPIARPPATTTFTLTVTDAAGCSKSDDVKVTVNVPPSSDFTAPDFLCGTSAGTFTYNGSTSGKTFEWNFDGGTPPTGTSSSHSVSWSTLGDKVVSLVTTQNSCSSLPVIKIVNVREMPTSTFDLPNSTCGASPVTIFYTGSAPSDATYTWGLDGGTIAEGSGQGPLLVSWATAGTKNVSLSVTRNGCVSGTTNEPIIAAFPYEGEKICLISVDLGTGKNMIIWERTKNVGIKAYKVYRETEVAGVYTVLDTIPFDSLSVYVDKTSEPESKSQKYRITAVDTCGNESSPSEWHRPMLLTSSVGTGGNSVNLAWTEYTKESGKLQFVSYIIYRGTTPTVLTPIDTIPADNTLFVDNTAPKGVDLYYRIAGVLSTPCVPKFPGKKAQSGPFIHSVSNLEDNRLQSTGVSELNMNSVGLTIYPNPFTDITTIKYTLHYPSSVLVEIYNVIGVKVKVLLDEKQTAGNHHIEFRSSDVDYMNGLYYIKFNVNKSVIVKKVMLNR